MQSKIKPLHFYAILAIACVAYPLFLGTALTQSSDTFEYQAAAQNILTGYHQINFRVPFYPLLLILTNSVYKLSSSLFWLQYVTYFGSVFLLIKTMVRSAISPATIFIIVLLVVSPITVRMIYGGLTETISFAMVNCLFVAYVLLPKGIWQSLLMALMLVLLTLTRPAFQLVGLCIAVFLFITAKKDRKPAIVFAIAFLLPVFVFSYFNKVKFKYFGLTPAIGWHLTTKTTAFIEKFPDPKIRPLLVNARNENLVKDGSSHTGTVFIWTVMGKIQDTLHMNFVDASNYMYRNNMQMIKQNPLEYLTAVFSSALEYFMPNGITGKDKAIFKMTYSFIQLAYVFFALAIAALVFACMWLRGRRGIKSPYINAFIFLFIIVTINYILSITIEVGSARHRQPTEAAILLLIVYGLPFVTETKRLISSKAVANNLA